MKIYNDNSESERKSESEKHASMAVDCWRLQHWNWNAKENVKR